MGRIIIQTIGSFGSSTHEFSATKNGHAHAVGEAIQTLSTKLLPPAINHDHQLHEDGKSPEEGFVKQ